MKLLPLSVLRLALLAAGATLFAQSRPAVAGPVQEGQEGTAEEGDVVEDKRPVIEQKVTQLGEYIKKRGEQDREAIAAIDDLLSEFKKSGPKDRAAIVKGLEKCFSVKRKPTEEGVPDNKLFIAAAAALGQMGPESVKTLSGLINHKDHRSDLQLQRELILSLGKTKEDSGQKTLTDLLTNKDATIQAAAAEALANFEAKPSDQRKEIFEALLKELMSVHGQVEADVNDTIARERYDVIAAPIITTLQRLSGQKIFEPNEWQRFWNKSKRDPWETSGS